MNFRPKLILLGYSSYPRHFDYERVRQIADKVGALLMADMAHISGLVATGNAPDLFAHCHLVSTTTHKTLRGPRGALVFCHNESRGKSLIGALHSATMPGFQGGSQLHTVAAIAAALKEADSEEFRDYAAQVLRNSKALAEALKQLGYTLFTNGTDNHLLLLNLRDKGIDGGRVETLFDLLSVSLNKNTLKGDVNALRPSGVRLGSPAMTSRGATEADFEQIARFLDAGIRLAVEANTFKKVSEFNQHVARLVREDSRFTALREEIRSFARTLPFNCLPIE